MTDAITERLEELDILLDKERKYLLSGDLIRLVSVSQAKSSLIAGLDQMQGRPDLPKVENILAKAGRNSQLLEQARDGLGAGLARIAEIRAIQDRLETYGPQGNRVSHETETVKRLERRT